MANVGKMKLSKEQKKNHNRAITVLVFAMFVSAFVSLNANTFLLSSGLYIGMSILSVFLYFAWNKF